MRLALDLLLGALRQPRSLAALDLRQWNALLLVARLTGLLGRLGGLARLHDLYADIPPQAGQHLADAELQARQQHTTLRWEVTRIERALRGIATPIVLLKGAAYVQAELPASLGRECSDIDILVAARELEAVERALLAHGWAFDELDPRDQRYFRLWLQELPPMRHRVRGSSIDVHHALLPRTDRLFIESEPLFARRRPVLDAVSVLSPADMVLHSAVHMFRNGDWSSALRDLSDQDLLLREFARRQGFWDELLGTAEAVRLTATCFYCLRYAQSYFHTPVPDEVVSRMSRFKPRLPPLACLDWLVSRALCPRRHDRADQIRAVSLSLLSCFPAPRPGAWLTPLFWLKRLPHGSS